MIYNKRKKEIYKERKKSESLVFYDIEKVKDSLYEESRIAFLYNLHISFIFHVHANVFGLGI